MSEVPLFLMSEVPLFLMSEVPLFLMSEAPLFLMSEVPLFLMSKVPLFLMSEVPLFLMSEVTLCRVEFEKEQAVRERNALAEIADMWSRRSDLTHQLKGFRKSTPPQNRQRIV